MQPDAQFCPKCGQPAGGPAGQPASGPAAQPGPFDGMGRREMRFERRRMRREARWSSYTSPEWTLFNMLFGGLFIILLGGLFYLASSGVAGDLVTWSNFWTYLLMGLGGMLFVRGLLEVFSRHSAGIGSIIGGMVLMVIGAAGTTMFLTGWTQYLWTAVIIIAGLVVILVGLLTYLFRRQA